jgi:hypothetical protein
MRMVLRDEAARGKDFGNWERAFQPPWLRSGLLRFPLGFARGFGKTEAPSTEVTQRSKRKTR